MKHISLFSGIGGFDLASEWMGWQNVASCEINSFGNKVLQYYWPQAYHHDDIKTLTYEKLNQELTTRFGADWRSDDIILTGGFPCQPYSAAGKRLGKEDERHLWPEMLRVIREVKPTWIVGENVLGLINWSGGLVFEEMQVDLDAEGYEVQPFVLPACAVNAPHRRDRVWFVARKEWSKVIFADECKFEEWDEDGEFAICPECLSEYSECPCPGPTMDEYEYKQIGNFLFAKPSSDTKRIRMEGNWAIWKQITQASAKEILSRCNYTGDNWKEWKTQSPICTGDDGLPTKLDGITFSKWRNESIKAAGNAIVPQVVYQIFKSIEQYEQNRNHGQDREAAD